MYDYIDIDWQDSVVGIITRNHCCKHTSGIGTRKQEAKFPHFLKYRNLAMAPTFPPEATETLHDISRSRNPKFRTTFNSFEALDLAPTLK